MPVIQMSPTVKVETYPNISGTLYSDVDTTHKDRTVVTIRDSLNNTIVASLSQKNGSTTEIHFLKTKGGVFTIVQTRQLTYLALPGSQLQLPDLLLNMPGDLPPGRLNPGSGAKSSHEVQTVTDQAMILGAGIASRFVPVSGELTGYAKPSVPLIGTDSVIVTLARHLQQHGIRKLLINTYYMPDILKQQLSVLKDLEIVFIDEEQPSGTAGGLLKAIDLGLLDLNQPLLVMQGDAVTDADLSTLLNTHQQKAPMATIGVKHISDEEVSQTAIVITDQSGPDSESGYVISFREKPTLAEAGPSRLASIGFYVLSPSVFSAFSAIGKAQWAQTQEYDYAFHFFPQLMEKHPHSIYARMLPQPFYWSDIGRPDQYIATVRDIYEGKLQLNLPDNAAQYYKDGIIYWEHAQEVAQHEGAVLKGNLIVFNRRF